MTSCIYLAHPTKYPWEDKAVVLVIFLKQILKKNYGANNEKKQAKHYRSQTSRRVQRWTEFFITVRTLHSDNLLGSLCTTVYQQERDRGRAAREIDGNHRYR
jgi:hypothetical protein